jgi:phytoene synthase
MNDEPQPLPAPLARADEYCRERASASGSSFHYSFLFLPPLPRRAITALYAWCREVDDAVDEASDPSVAAARLAWWGGEVEALFAGAPTHPVSIALAPHLPGGAITKPRMALVLEGMHHDLVHDRIADRAALDRYCHHVAGVVGEMAAGIFGAREPATLEYARELGRALQYVNIARDVGEDARRGRIYIPQSELARHGVREEDLLAGRAGEGFVRLMREHAQLARAAFARALALLPAHEARSQRAGLVMGAIYAALLGEIERDGFAVLTQRTSLTPLRKLFIAWRTWVFGPPRSMREARAPRARSSRQ